MCVYSRWLYFVLGLIVFSPIATAQTAPTNAGFAANGVFVQAVGVKSASLDAATGNVVSMQQFRVTNGTAPLKYYDRAVAYNKAQYGNKVKGVIKANALNAALIATTIGLGYFLDYVTGDLYASPPKPQQNCNFGVYESYNVQFSACTLAEVISFDKKYHLNIYNSIPGYYNNSYEYWNLISTSNNTYNYLYNIKYYSGLTGPYDACGNGCNNPILYKPALQNTTATPALLPASDQELAQWFLDNNQPEDWKQPFINPGTGAVTRDQQNAQAEKDLYNELAPQLGKAVSNANPVTPLAPELQKAPSYDELPSGETNNFSLEFPDFCSWASTVCGAIDWVQDLGSPPETTDFQLQDMINETDTQPVNYSSGLGSGSCPADRQFSVYGTSLNYSYQPLCELADIARIFVIIFAYLSSIYIVMGVRR